MTLNEARDKLAEKFPPPDYNVRVKAECWSFTTTTKSTDFHVSIGEAGSGTSLFRQEGPELEPLVEAAFHAIGVRSDNPATATPEGS